MEDRPGSGSKPSLTERFNALDTPRFLALLGIAVGVLAVASVLIMSFGNSTPMPSGAWYNKPIELMNCQELGAYDAANIKPTVQPGSSVENSAKLSSEVARLQERAAAIGGCPGSENW